MDTPEKTPQQRLDEDHELLDELYDAAEHPERAVPRKDRHTEDIIPPELRPHRW